MAEKVYLVRHGRHDRDGLTTQGLEDARKARETLLAKGIGRNALILSSSSTRAMSTADIIGSGMQAQIVPSVRMMEGGRSPDGIKDLDEWITRALDETGTPTSEHELIVVTHAPLIAVAKGHSRQEADYVVDYGEVYDYVPGSWVNPEFSEVAEEWVEFEITKHTSS